MYCIKRNKRKKDGYFIRTIIENFRNVLNNIKIMNGCFEDYSF